MWGHKFQKQLLLLKTSLFGSIKTVWQIDGLSSFFLVKIRWTKEYSLDTDFLQFNSGIS